MAKKACFGISYPNNRKQQKIDPAYHVGNFPSNFLKTKIFPKNWVLTSLWRHKVAIFGYFRHFFDINDLDSQITTFKIHIGDT